MTGILRNSGMAPLLRSLQNAGVCMILSAFLSVPALAEQVRARRRCARRRLRLVAAGAGRRPRPAVIGLHGCNGLYVRGELNARERGLADLLRGRGFHVLLPDSFTPRGLRELCTTPLAQRTLRAADRRADIQGRSTGWRRGPTSTARASS